MNKAVAGFIALFLLAPGCATTLVTAVPEASEGQRESYKTGTPMIASHGAHSDVAVCPNGGPTGRYEFSGRIPLFVFIRNRTGADITVSEDDISVRAVTPWGNANATVLRATQLEDEARDEAARAHAVNVFALAAATLANSTAGTTYHEFRVGNTTVTGTSYDPSATAREDRRAAAEARERSAEIDRREQEQLSRVALLLQANTLTPGEAISAGLYVERPRISGCESDGAPLDCTIIITVSVAGDMHRFRFREARRQ